MVSARADGSCHAGFIFALSAIDTVLLLGLMFCSCALERAPPRELFLGQRPIAAELGVGVLHGAAQSSCVVVRRADWSFAPSRRPCTTSRRARLRSLLRLAAACCAAFIVARADRGRRARRAAARVSAAPLRTAVSGGARSGSSSRAWRSVSGTRCRAGTPPSSPGSSARSGARSIWRGAASSPP